MLDWLMSPIDPSRAHAVSGWIAWHGRLMVLAWAVLVPLGILAARFFKITPKQDWPRRLDNPGWWHAHRSLQYAAGILMLLATCAAIVALGRPGLTGMHAACGWSVLALAAVQYTGGWLRGSKGGPTAPAPDGSLRGDHYDMTTRRRLFEYVHKSVGYLAWLLACLSIATGLWRANAPVGFWLMIAGWWALCILAFATLQRRGRAVDTYQAIWGADASHPGNWLRPIGWGVRKLSPSGDRDHEHDR